MGRLDPLELAGLRWLLGQLLILISLAGSYTIDLQADLLVTVSLAMVSLVTIFPALTRLIPHWLWRVAPALLLLAIVTDFFLSRGDILPPLFRMVIYLALYRSLQARTPREDLQVLLLSLFIILITGVLSLELSFGLQMVLYAPLAMALLFVANLSVKEAGEEPRDARPDFYRFRWRTLLARGIERLDRRTLFAGAGIFLMTSGLTFLLFIFLPRFDIGAALPFPRLQTGQSLTGFTDHVQYGDVVSILDDDAIAMRVDVVMENPPARPYWRMVVLDAYYDGGFMVSPKVARNRRILSDYLFTFEDLMDPEYLNESQWTVYLEGGISAYLPAGDSFRSLRFQNRVQLQLHELTRVFRTSETNANTLSIRYTGMSFSGILPASFDDLPLRSAEPLLQDTTDASYLQEVQYPATLMVIPESRMNQQILEKVLRESGIPDGLPTSEFAEQLVRYLQESRGYRLDTSIAPGEGDRLLRWLDSGQPGHCELFAGAFVLLSRYAGYPARLITGYAGGDWNGFENYYMVRNRDAHAWCEIFDPTKGWIRADPTPGNLGDSGTVSSALDEGWLRLDRTWAAYLDSLRVLWFRRVIQFDSEDQQIIADTAKGLGLSGLDWLRASLADLRETLRKDWSLLVRHGDWSGLLGDLAIPVLILLLAFLAGGLFHQSRRARAFEQIMRRRAGMMLRRKALSLSEKNPQVYQLLLLVRYGPVHSWPENVEGRLRKL